jgi:hypothetical protein
VLGTFGPSLSKAVFGVFGRRSFWDLRQWNNGLLRPCRLKLVSWGPVLARSPAGPQGSVGSLGLIGFFCCVFGLVCGNFVAVTALRAWCGRHRNHTCEGGGEQARCRFLFLQATLLTNWCTQAHRCLDSIHSDIAGKESRPPTEIFRGEGKVNMWGGHCAAALFRK